MTASIDDTDAGIEQELAALREKLDALREQRSLPLLESLRVASPCNADWNAMVGDDRALGQ